MSASKKFAPYFVPVPPAKAAKVANAITADRSPPASLAGLATLAAVPAETANSSSRSAASSKNPADEVHAPPSINRPLAEVPTNWVYGLAQRGRKSPPCARPAMGS
jgi:hypothetical protein